LTQHNPNGAKIRSDPFAESVAFERNPLDAHIREVKAIRALLSGQNSFACLVGAGASGIASRHDPANHFCEPL
jgi:hypothetical protein